jgi:hypothetical protein
MSGGNFQRTPIVRSIQQVAQRKAEAAIELLGKALPCEVVSRKGAIVTVKFALTNVPFNLPQIDIPIIGSEYIRVPVQAGCKGLTISADASLGAVTGLGPATVGLALPANLTALVFVPIGNKDFAPEHADHLELYGADGVLIKNKKDKDWYMELTSNGAKVSNADGSASFAWNGAAWEFKGPVIMNNGVQLAGIITGLNGGRYSGNIDTSGTITSGNITLTTHHHTAQGATAPTTAAQP